MAIEFSPALSLPLGGQASALLTSDLNGDGNLDLVANFTETSSFTASSSGLAVFYGIGGGQFAAAQKLTVKLNEFTPQYTAYQQQYAAYQQRYQTALQNYQNFVNSLPAGITPPPFTYFETPPVAPSQTQAQVAVSAIAVGDVDRDGKQDLITIGTYPTLESQGLISIARQKPIISVLKGTGSGFAAAVNSPVTAITDFPGGLAIGDFNGDGNLDAATIRAGNIADNANKQQAVILYGDSTGLFGNETAIPLGFDTSDIIAADFNGDGRTDLTVAGGSSGYGIDAKVSILLSEPTGQLSAPNPIPIQSNSFPFKLYSADFNGDGKLDLATSSEFLAGDGTGQFKDPKPLFGLNGNNVTGDFNGDGNLDIAGYYSVAYGPGSISILLGNGAGNYTIPTSAFGSEFPRAIAVGDFDRDGKPDIALANGIAPTLAVALNRTTSTERLVITDDTIDASLETGGLILDLKQGTLQIGSISRSLSGTYQSVRGSQQGDRVTGGQLKEFIDGLAGNDVIVSGEGNDFLLGGTGKDVLTGGKGKDQFMFSNGEAFIEIRSIPFDRTMGVDKITDFEVKQDKINLYRDTFTALSGRRISFESVTTKKAAQTSKALITYIPKTGSLFYNQNGAKAGFGSGGRFADLTNGLELRAKNFLVTDY